MADGSLLDEFNTKRAVCSAQCINIIDRSKEFICKHFSREKVGGNQVGNSVAVKISDADEPWAESRYEHLNWNHPELESFSWTDIGQPQVRLTQPISCVDCRVSSFPTGSTAAVTK